LHCHQVWLVRERKRGKAGILVPLGVGRGGEFKEGFSAIGVNEDADKTKRGSDQGFV